MITYRNAIQCPKAFLKVFGCTVDTFDLLYADFATAYERRVRDSTLTRRDAMPRRRKPGAGRRFKHSLQDRLLMALFWRRVRPTLELLGTFFDLDKTSAEDNLKDVLETLVLVSLPPLEQPGPDMGKLRTPEGAMSAFPGLARIIEGEEKVERIRGDRPEPGCYCPTGYSNGEDLLIKGDLRPQEPFRRRCGGVSNIDRTTHGRKRNGDNHD